MALVHWWPLNGDLMDKVGNNPLVLTNNNNKIQQSNNGKIGKCYERTATGTSDLLRSANKMQALTEETICAWVYVSQHAALSTANGIVSNHSHEDESGLGIGMYSTDGTNYYVSINAGTGSSRIHSSYWGRTNIKGAWHHVCLTYGLDKKIRMYVDGKEDRDPVSYDLYNIIDYLDVFNWSTTHYTNTSYRPACKVCDVRVYDHALSQAEIKELSKALTVHYTFNDTLSESTTNVNTVSGWSTYSAYWTISEKTETGLKLYRHTGSTSDCAAIQNSAVTSKMAQGDIWTFSCYLYKNGQPWKSTASGISSETYGYKTISQESYDDGYYRATFQITKSPDAWVLHNYFFSPIDIDVECEMRYMQFEKKDHATPYTPTSREGILANEAGCSGNGTLYNSSLSTDTASGTLSCHTPRINPDSINTMVSTTNAAYAYADVFGYNHTPTEFTVAWWWKIIDWGYGTGPFGLVISKGDYMNSTLGVHDRQAFINFAGGDTRIGFPFTSCGLNSWNHFAITYKPGEAISYVNGVKHTTHTPNASLTLDPWRYLYLGAGCAGGCLRDGDIYWGDFRYYSTALSADEISRLYRTKAYVTDQGDFCAGEFNEYADKARVKENYVAECSSLSDGLPNGYARLEYLESNGNQFIDTGFVPNQDTRVRAEIVLPIANATQACFGCRVSSGDIQYQFVTQGNRYRTDYNLTYVYVTPTSTYAPTGKIFVDKNKNYTNVNNDYSYTHGYGTFTAPGNLYVFATNAKDKTVDAYAKATMKLYDMQIYDNGKLIRNYFPSINPSGVPGLYDTINNVFYASKTSTPFIAGPVLMTGRASLLEGGGIGGREIIEV